MKRAEECWKQGYNCAESTMRGVCHAQGIDLDDLSMKMATPFGGGVGRAQDLCGAISGAVMGIGAVRGRVLPSEDRLRSYDAAGKLHRRFVEEFGSSSCRVLNKGEFESSEHRKRCGRFVSGATRIAIEILRTQ